MRSSKARSSPAFTNFQSVFSSVRFIWTQFIFKQSRAKSTQLSLTLKAKWHPTGGGRRRGQGINRISCS
jgi:hypothetical protein